jgi:hypothetical protein
MEIASFLFRGPVETFLREGGLSRDWASLLASEMAKDGVCLRACSFRAGRLSSLMHFLDCNRSQDR